VPGLTDSRDELAWQAMASGGRKGQQEVSSANLAAVSKGTRWKRPSRFPSGNLAILTLSQWSAL